jgi:hypothetical protein
MNGCKTLVITVNDEYIFGPLGYTCLRICNINEREQTKHPTV